MKGYNGAQIVHRVVGAVEGHAAGQHQVMARRRALGGLHVAGLGVFGLHQARRRRRAGRPHQPIGRHPWPT